MAGIRRHLIALACALCAIAACSQSPHHGGPTSDNAAALDCSRVFAATDVIGILVAPIDVARNPYRSGCTIESNDSSIQVYVGSDTTSQLSWQGVHLEL